MKALFSFFLVSMLAPPAPSQDSGPLREPVATSLQANSLIDGLLKIAGRFELPLAVEWVQSPDALGPIRLSRNFTTAKGALDAVVSAYRDYTWQVENGIVHVFRTDIVSDPRNPLNVVISEVPDRSWTVNDADNFLFQSIGQAVRSIGPKELSTSSSADIEPQFRLAAHNAPVREVLNQIITASKMKIWIATFLSKLPLTGKGFWEVSPMFDPKYVKAEDQPFWIFLRWADAPWKRLQNPPQ